MQENILKIFASKMGMLPVGLVHNREVDDMRFAMLDGGTHNYCLDVCLHSDVGLFRSNAWSSNMSSYIHVEGDTLRLYTLNKREPEILPVHYVVDYIDKFYQYIGLQHKNDQNVVSFLMDQFRIIRNSLREKDAAVQSLNLFLYILSAAQQNEQILYNDDYSDALQLVDRALVEEVIERIKYGSPESGFKTNIELVLRHASGQLFEEANFLANYSSQLELFPSTKINYSVNPNTVGTFYTPAFIARSIVEEALRQIDLEKKTELTIFDPACGSGEFLSEALRQLKMMGYKGALKIIGWDISPIAILITRYILGFEKREWGNIKFETEIKRTDSLAEQWPVGVDMILMNPPYISWGLMSLEQRENISSIMRDKGTPNSSSVFYYLASKSLKTDGVIGALVPTSLLYSNSHRKIREEAFEKVHPVLIGQLGYHVFRAAFVDVSIIIASNTGKDEEKTMMLWSANKESASHDALRNLRILRQSGFSGTTASDRFSIYEVPSRNLKESNLWIPMSSNERELKECVEELVVRGVLVRISDVFTVSQGARTGNNDVFIISSSTYLSLSNEEKQFFRPTVDSDSLIKGILSPKHYMFFPYPEQKFSVNTEKELAERLPFVYSRILLPNKSKLEKRAGIDSTKWWLLTRPRTWQFEKAEKMVSTEFGHSGNFGIDEKGEYVVERGNGWFLKDEKMPKMSLYVYVAIFNSPFFDELLSIYSSRLAGKNCYVLENKHVKDIPIPNFNNLESEVARMLYDAGKALVNGESFNKEKVEIVIRSMYGQK